MNEENFDLELLNNDDDFSSDNKINFNSDGWSDTIFNFDFKEKTIFSKTIKISSDLVYILKIKKQIFWFWDDSYYFCDYVRSPKYHQWWKIKTPYLDYWTVIFLPFILEKMVEFNDISALQIKDDSDAIWYFTDNLKSKKEALQKAFEIMNFEYKRLQDHYKEREIFENHVFDLDLQYNNELDEFSNYSWILENNKNVKNNEKCKLHENK